MDSLENPHHSDTMVGGGTNNSPSYESHAHLERMKELTLFLKKASKAYYAHDEEIISNLEYDTLYEELRNLEIKTGTILAGSPTVTVGYEAVDELEKEVHESPMLSLDKTKDREHLAEWLQGKEGLLSWKLDGLTIVLTYEDGKLSKAVTRGNGEIGEVITNNANVFKNIPLSIPVKEKLILRGEAVITYEDFDKINASITNPDEKYKNPRNLCSGSVRQLNNQITEERNVRFYAFNLVLAGTRDYTYRDEEMEFMKGLGFEIVEYKKVSPATVSEEVEYFEEKIEDFPIPSDGLVLVFNDIAFGKSLGRTAKFPRDSIAFKWMDEKKETRLLDVEWSPSRTGLINPIAIFDPVELEGTTVTRASLHNVSILKNLKLGIGDLITVYKANMIIPQIAENLTMSDNLVLPKICPACGKEAVLRQVNEVESLYCANPGCSAKKIKSFTHFVSRDAMNIEGLSEATLEKFIARGFLKDFVDIFHIDNHGQEIMEMEGFGEKSFLNLLNSINAARKTTLPRVLYSLGIANIGLSNAKMICKEFKNDFVAISEAGIEELSSIDGIGEIIAGTFVEYFSHEKNKEIFTQILKEVELEKEVVSDNSDLLKGKSFAITGSLIYYANRNELKEKIESLGGKVTGTVTSKTYALINNDVSSNSSKNKKARELGIPIMTEEDIRILMENKY